MEAKNIFDLIPFIPRVTSVKDYVPYRHSRLLLQTRYKELPVDKKGLPVDLAKMMEAIGYRKRLKFLTRMKELWVNAQGKIPLKFLELLDITKEDLLWVLEFDKQDFRETLKDADKPEYFQYKIMPCVYPVEKLPEGISENEAVAYIIAFMQTQPEWVQKYGAHITYNGLKTLWIESDGSTSVSYYVPDIIFEGGYVIFKTQPMPGTVTIR
ncbi:MAG: hypothetical protein ABSC19_01980 [Syntrophorhabdales bacterium]|jgi:hypothetical protein